MIITIKAKYFFSHCKSTETNNSQKMLLWYRTSTNWVCFWHRLVLPWSSIPSYIAVQVFHHYMVEHFSFQKPALQLSVVVSLRISVSFHENIVSTIGQCFAIKQLHWLDVLQTLWCYYRSMINRTYTLNLKIWLLTLTRFSKCNTYFHYHRHLKNEYAANTVHPF